MLHHRITVLMFTFKHSSQLTHVYMYAGHCYTMGWVSTPVLWVAAHTVPYMSLETMKM